MTAQDPHKEKLLSWDQNKKIPFNNFKKNLQINSSHDIWNQHMLSNKLSLLK